MNRKEIHFVIDQEGNIQSTIKGLKGPTCSAITEAFRDLGQVIEQQQTNEYFESGTSSQISLDLTHKG